MDAKRKGPVTRGVATLTLVTILAVAGACGNDTMAAKDKSPGMAKTASSVADSRSTAIPQPTAAQLAAAGFENLPRMDSGPVRRYPRRRRSHPH
jgi:hypothetical protein